MKITVIYGTERHGATYNIAKEVISYISNAEVTEIFLPKDLPEFCISCLRCFTEEKGVCAHEKYTIPIREKLLSANLIIMTSPVYSMHVTGQMKVLLDHFANMWIVHRPEKEMFKKQGLVIATASGPVYKKTLNEMKDSLDFWGVAKTYKMGFALMETRFEKVQEKIKTKISKKAKQIALKIEKNNRKIKPCFRVRKWFFISKIMQKYFKLNPADLKYWQTEGWLKGKKPWNE